MPNFITEQEPLATRTTLGVGGPAEFFAEVRTLEELQEAVDWANDHHIPITILGGGSNVLVADSGVSGLVLKPCFDTVVREDTKNETHITVGSGVILDDFIQSCVDQNLWGVENLSGIPGTVGGVPIQNVGAYGVEACDIIHSVEVFNYKTSERKKLSNNECQFSYRNSLFKQPEGISYIVTHVTFRLSSKPNPQLTYKDLAYFFSSKLNPSLSEIRDAVLLIRRGKFPDWTQVGTAGSFFKNPVITRAEFELLKEHFPELPGFVYDDSRIKVSLGWILDHVCNVRGYTDGDVGLYEKQALVLVCNKGTSASEVENFSKKIIAKVFSVTNIVVECEVTKVS